jgi:hypothetical protein
MKRKRCRHVSKPSRRVKQTRRVQSRPGANAKCKKWSLPLVKATRRYRGLIALSFHPDLCVCRRDEPISRLLPSETRIQRMRIEEEVRLRAVRGRSLVSRMRGRAETHMSTDDIMALTRGSGA